MAGTEGAATIDQLHFPCRGLDILDNAEIDPASFSAVVGGDFIKAEGRRSGHHGLGPQGQGHGAAQQQDCGKQYGANFQDRNLPKALRKV
jgi:hypothetical protein